MTSPSNPRAALQPSRALLHPLWLGSLAVLVLNDHVLKGASILPGAVTGKLSDFAGLMVAPVLLAMLLRARTTRGWIAAHVAVGVGFGAIQLSAAAATGWSALMGLVGFPWLITRDVTDLVALPALAVSAWVLRSAMRRPVTGMARRSAELTAAGTGLVCCAATSPAPSEPWISDITTDVYVHNASDEPVVVRMRQLAPSVDLECHAVAEDPGRLVTEPLFGDSRSFVLDPEQNFGLVTNINEWGWDDWEGSEWDENGEPIEPVTRDCTAVLLDIDGMPPAVVLWQNGQVPRQTIPGVGGDPSLGRLEIHPSGNPDTLGHFEQDEDTTLLHLVPPAEPPVAGACAPQGDGGRLYWSSAPPAGTWELLEAEYGADGCYGLDLGTRDLDGEVLQSQRWYLCVPLSTLGIEPGRLVDVSLLGAGSGGDGGVIVSTADQITDPTLPFVQLQAYRGTNFPSFHGLSVGATPEFECSYVVGERCGTVTRATTVTAGGGDFEVVPLQPGERATLMGQGDAQMTIALAHSEERAALDPECAEGPDTLGLDLEFVALYIEPPV